MSTATQLPTGVNPKITENFLLNQQEVVDASVWWSRGNLLAHVTVPEGAHVDERHLQRLCLETLGILHTPRVIVLIQSNRWSA